MRPRGLLGQVLVTVGVVLLVFGVARPGGLPLGTLAAVFGAAVAAGALGGALTAEPEVFQPWMLLLAFGGVAVLTFGLDLRLSTGAWALGVVLGWSWTVLYRAPADGDAAASGPGADAVDQG